MGDCLEPSFLDRPRGHKGVRLLPQSGRPLEDPSKGSENNAIIKITNLFKDAAVKEKRLGTSNIQRPTSNFE